MTTNIKFLLLIIFIISFNKLFSTKISTICNGVSGDLSVWEGNEFYQSYDTVYINHFIHMSGPFNLNVNTVIINENGELCGNCDLMIPYGSKIINYGSICAETITLQDSLLNYGEIKVGLFTITNGLFVSDEGTIVVDQFECFDDLSCTPIIINLGNNYIASNILAYEYYWMRDNIPLNINGQQILIEQAGYYKIKIKILPTDDYSGFSDSLYVAPMNIDENIFSRDIKVFPNPTASKITIQAENIQNVKLYNLQRKLIYDGIKNEVDLSSEAKGIYIIKVQTSKGVAVEKVVVE